MNNRIDLEKHLSSNLGQAMLALSAASAASGLERSLLELVRLRASQINHCAYCIDMHTKDARAQGENGAAALLGQRVARSAVVLRA
jgi:AhpD family alkylhydroperoxidase